jgi:hypothetical protein
MLLHSRPNGTTAATPDETVEIEEFTPDTEIDETAPDTIDVEIDSAPPIMSGRELAYHARGLTPSQRAVNAYMYAAAAVPVVPTLKQSAQLHNVSPRLTAHAARLSQDQRNQILANSNFTVCEFLRFAPPSDGEIAVFIRRLDDEERLLDIAIKIQARRKQAAEKAAGATA